MFNWFKKAKMLTTPAKSEDELVAQITALCLQYGYYDNHRSIRALSKALDDAIEHSAIENVFERNKRTIVDIRRGRRNAPAKFCGVEFAVRRDNRVTFARDVAAEIELIKSKLSD
jgi:hypothetical protein